MKGFNEQHKAFIVWLATPKTHRQPKTQEAFAKSLDVNSVTLWRWKQKDGFMQAVWGLAKLHISDQLADILLGQAKIAAAGRTSAARLIFEVCGLLESEIAREELSEELQDLVETIYNENS